MTSSPATGALAALGAALLLAPAGTAVAQAAPLAAPTTALQPARVAPAMGALGDTTGYVLGPAKDLRLDPFAQSAADPLNNALSLKPDNGVPKVSTTAATGALSNGGGAKDLPVAGLLLHALPG
ncbi:hypothetical protein C7C46_05275 [Streptomyces tateyamensis]|uniref:ATP-binding protein n=1 Tax=Streptomyces tateyamensis TaxID=565073 RepID=A0A2V4NMF3_9ACTN|nr:hypothetical protein [Streptomyces tateyamensis]PYC86903.1 hypothetical protein C7C46_05275 [Streptomyces tateyamensis]